MLTKTWELWRNVPQGFYGDLGQLNTALQRHDCIVTPGAVPMLEQLSIKALYSTLPVTLVSIFDLGLQVGCQIKDVINAGAKTSGLRLCPQILGPYLRIDYTNQPAHQHWYMAMETLLDAAGLPSVFHLFRDQAQMLELNRMASSAIVHSATVQFVFLLDK